MKRQEILGYGTKHLAGGSESPGSSASNRLWPFPSRAPIQISRVRTHAEATNAAREGANHWRRPESSVPICSAICVSYRAARRAVELDERWTARRLEFDSGARFRG